MFPTLKALVWSYTTLLSLHRALKNMVTRNPFQSLRQLAVAMFDWEKDMVNKLPLGARSSTPRAS